MAYVDGFLLTAPKKKVDEYLGIARKAGKVWKEHGRDAQRPQGTSVRRRR